MAACWQVEDAGELCELLEVSGWGREGGGLFTSTGVVEFDGMHGNLPDNAKLQLKVTDRAR